MIFRQVDTKNDWKLGGGMSSYATANNAIMLGIATTLRTFLGECFFNTDIGVNWFQLINERNKDYVILSIKSAISGCYGVVSVNEVTYTYDVSRVLKITYTINTLYENNVQGTVTI